MTEWLMEKAIFVVRPVPTDGMVLLIIGDIYRHSNVQVGIP